jgi:two-component system, NarL family, response regulator LiaR
MSNRIKVLIVEDHEIIRLGLKIALSQEPRLQVVGVAGDGFTGVSAAIDLRPDVVLMDIGLPGIDGIETHQTGCSLDALDYVHVAFRRRLDFYCTGSGS